MPRVRYPKVLIAREKHGARYFHIRAASDLVAASVKIVSARLEEGWYEGGDAETAKRAVTPSTAPDEDPFTDAAWRLLEKRTREGYEYESVYLEDYEAVS